MKICSLSEEGLFFLLQKSRERKKGMQKNENEYSKKILKKNQLVSIAGSMLKKCFVKA